MVVKTCAVTREHKSFEHRSPKCAYMQVYIDFTYTQPVKPHAGSWTRLQSVLFTQRTRRLRQGGASSFVFSTVTSACPPPTEGWGLMWTVEAVQIPQTCPRLFLSLLYSIYEQLGVIKFRTGKKANLFSSPSWSYLQMVRTAVFRVHYQIWVPHWSQFSESLNGGRGSRWVGTFIGTGHLNAEDGVNLVSDWQTRQHHNTWIFYRIP